MSETERKKLFKYYQNDIISALSGGCLENILNSWTVTLTTGDVIEFVVDKTQSVLTNIGDLITNYFKLVCKDSMYFKKNRYLDEFDKGDEKVTRQIEYVQLKLHPETMLNFFRGKRLINKPAADGKVTKEAIEQYLEYIDDEKEAIIERCQKIWA